MDDEEGPRASLKIVFKNDFDILLASNGADALKLAREHPVDVAILDILMPGMSGVEVLRELKQLDADIEVIMLTAYETLDTARQALRLGARDYLNKPFDIAILRAAAAKALERRRHAIELKAAHARLHDLRKEIAITQHSDAASHVVHDINNPLTVISGYVELLNRQLQNVAKVEGQELEKFKASIARVKSQTDRCVEISRRYLSSRRREQEDSCSVNEVLRDLQILLAEQQSANGGTIVLRELDTPARAAINAADLLRVALNLTTNALHASDEASTVEVTARSHPAGSSLDGLGDSSHERLVRAESFTAHSPLISISVRDTGRGIPPDIVRRIFHEQVTTKPEGKGTGLGLGSVKSIILATGGAIHMTTTPGKGTVFTIYIPAA